MALALSTYIGKGTRTNPFRPKLEGASIDLRPDCTVPDGYALVNTEDRVRHKLGDDFKDTFGARIRNRVHNLMGVDVSRVKRFDVLAAKLLMEPNGWKPLTPARDRYEIWLGGLVWEFPLVRGGASDDFNRADGTINAGNPSWVKASTSNAATINISGNLITGSNASDKYYYYSGAAVTASQYAQLTIRDNSADLGPAVRMSSDSDPGGADMYLVNPAINEYNRIINGSYQTIGAFPSTAVNDTVRLEVEGSTLQGYVNGTPATPRTDTNIAAANNGVGIFHFDLRADDWSGGDLVTAPQILVLHRHALGGGRW